MDRNSKVSCSEQEGFNSFPIDRSYPGTFSDGHMTDTLKALASDPGVDRRVKKKLTLVLGSWREQYKDDPAMSVIAGLYRQCIGEGKRLSQRDVAHLIGMPDTSAEEKRRQEKQEAKQKAKLEAKQEKARREQEALLQEARKNKSKRAPFNFEQVRILASRAHHSLILPPRRSPKY